MSKKIMGLALVLVMILSAVSVCAAADLNWNQLSGVLKELNVDAGLEAADAIASADGQLGTNAPQEGTESVIYKQDGDLYYRIYRSSTTDGWQADENGYSMAAVSEALEQGEWYVFGTYKKQLVPGFTGERTVCAFVGVDTKLEDAVPVSGEAPYAYTWFENEIVTGTNKGLTVTNITKAKDGYTYKCTVEDSDSATAATGIYTLKVLDAETLSWNTLPANAVSLDLDEGVDQQKAEAQANKELGTADASAKKQIVIYSVSGDGLGALYREKGEFGWRTAVISNVDTAVSYLSDADIYVIGTVDCSLTVKAPTVSETKKIVYRTGTDKISITVAGGTAPYTYSLYTRYPGQTDWSYATGNTINETTYTVQISDMNLNDNNMELCINVADSKGENVTGPITTAEVTVPYEITGEYFKPNAATSNCVLTIAKGDNTITKDNLLSVSFAGKDITNDLLSNKNGSIRNNSLTVTLNRAYLNTLKLGSYKLVVKLGNEQSPVVIEETITVSNVPKTSDNTHIVLLSALLTVCAGAAVLAGRKRRVTGKQ